MTLDVVQITMYTAKQQFQIDSHNNHLFILYSTI